MFENKEEVRGVYGFSDDDPDFDRFYDGLELMADGRTNLAESTFVVLLKDHPITNPAVYKYAIVAMLNNGALPEDLTEYTDMWVKCANFVGKAKDMDEAAFVNEAFNAIKEHPDQRESLIARFGSGKRTIYRVSTE